MEATQAAITSIDVIEQSGATNYLIFSGIIGNIIALIVIGYVFNNIVRWIGSRKKK